MTYRSNFQASPAFTQFLLDGRMIDAHETPAAFIERMVNALAAPEAGFGTPRPEIDAFEQDLGIALEAGLIVPSTPIMMNAGRHSDRPLSACTVPPVDLKGDLHRIKHVVDRYHQDGMGTGFDLTGVDDPVAVLEYLNQIAIDGAASGREERPVGNMATCHISHPRIEAFITSKAFQNREKNWKFNISVVVDEVFMAAAANGTPYLNAAGESVDAPRLLRLMAETAHDCGDPGLIDLERMERDNPTPKLGHYVSTAPCAEVGLAPGETCQFGYINLGKFVNDDGINYIKLAQIARLTARMLDNALEISLPIYGTEESKRIMNAKRKIGVGVCGVADLLAKLNARYDSPAAQHVLTGVLSTINFATKEQSVELARMRGTFSGFADSRYNETPSLIERKFVHNHSGRISRWRWQKLSDEIKTSGLLRNATTTALPPTGRSALVFGASTGIEPFFSLSQAGKLNPTLQDYLERNNLALSGEEQAVIVDTGSVQQTNLPDDVKRVFRTALEIEPDIHLQMAAVAQSVVDEAVSKTINLPHDIRPVGIVDIFLRGHRLGMKGIAVYRNQSREMQPRKLASA